MGSNPQLAGNLKTYFCKELYPWYFCSKPQCNVLVIFSCGINCQFKLWTPQQILQWLDVRKIKNIGDVTMARIRIIKTAATNGQV